MASEFVSFNEMFRVSCSRACFIADNGARIYQFARHSQERLHSENTGKLSVARAT